MKTEKLTRCPCCKKPVNSTHFACVNVAVAGSVKSEAKANAARENGKKGGWHSWKKNREKLTIKGDLETTERIKDTFNQ